MWIKKQEKCAKEYDNPGADVLFDETHIELYYTDEDAWDDIMFSYTVKAMDKLEEVEKYFVDMYFLYHKKFDSLTFDRYLEGVHLNPEGSSCSDIWGCQFDEEIEKKEATLYLNNVWILFGKNYA
jgi:hypothetical protein